jgi:tetratricopeptide (TPR) repeat protein
MVCLASTAVDGQVVLPPGLGMPGGQTVPSPGFDLAINALAAGEFTRALEIASREYRGGVKAGDRQWIDSIAAAAVVGECHFELGNLREAVAAYDDALRLAAAHGDWLLAVQFPAQGLRPLQQQRVATWGRSQRNTSPAAIPGPASIRVGGADPQRALQQGGVLSAPVNYPVRPQEIMRATVIAIYRRGVILGESGRDGPAIDEVTKALLRRSAPPNHYSQSWVEIALGTALWAQGKPDQAAPLLNRGLLIGNQFDHPLTSWGLIVLGRIALDADQPAAAARLFEEATYTAADYLDPRALEESFRLLAIASMAADARTVPTAVIDGCAWAKGSMPLLRAGLLGLQAEQLATAGEVQAAADALADIDARLLRGDPGRGQVGAQHAYASALVAYAHGNTGAGDRELEKAVSIARSRSATLFRTQRLVESLLAGGNAVSDRQADAAFARLLADPSAHEVALDPLDGLVALASPRTEAYDAWVSVASRRGDDAVLNAVEAAVRSRWLATQPLGGRRSTLARLFASDPAALSPASAGRRAGLLARHPELPALLDGMLRDRTALTAALLAAAPARDAVEPAAVPGDPATWRDYRQLATRLEPLVSSLAAGRDAVPIEMPPLTPAPEIRRRLGAKQLLLSFHWSSMGLRAALESRDRVRVWTVRQPTAVSKELGGLARGLSLFESSAPVAADRLLAGEWAAAVERIERLLFENAQVSLGDGIEELVIVPDGILWYLPFELLPVGTARAAAGPGGAAAEERRLRDVCRVRYCPTRSLAVLAAEPAAAAGPVGIYAGRLMRGDKPASAQEVGARLVDHVDHGVSLPAVATTAPVPLVASLLDTLVVVEELSTDGAPESRPLVTTQQGRQGMTFGDWLEPPAKRPQCVVLPGLQTAMAGGLSKPPAHPGEELFVAITSLMVAGSRTVLASRWRTGGESSIDLVEEFLRDRGARGPHGERPAAAESWQRAVDIISAEQPDPGREPRIKPSPEVVLKDARHPFFWAGYLLADCGEGRFPDAPPAPPMAAAQPPARPAPVAARAPGQAAAAVPAAAGNPAAMAPAAANPAPAAPRPAARRPLNPAAPRNP